MGLIWDGIGQAFFEVTTAAQGSLTAREMPNAAVVTHNTFVDSPVDVTVQWGVGVTAAESIELTNLDFPRSKVA